MHETPLSSNVRTNACCKTFDKQDISSLKDAVFPVQESPLQT